MNYKELCKFFNEDPIQGGTNRQRQLTRFSKTHEIKKIGRGQYEIVRERTKEEIMLNSDKEHYSKYLQTILLNMIAENPELTITLTYRQIRENLMMVNKHYFPVKYHKEKSDIKLPYQYDNMLAYDFEKQWLDIADAHDSTTIKYALNALKNRHLLVSLQETYMFYKFEKDKEGNTIYHKPIVATEKQKAEIMQRQMDFIKNHLSFKQMEDLRIEKTKEEDKSEEIYGKYLHELFKQGGRVMDDYYEIITHYAKEQGYNRYARAFTITRLPELKRIAEYFAPEFNKQQVERYLSSSRFKTIPPFIHKQLTEQLIKS